jgi:DNA replication and repair protein RecF
VLRSAQRDGGGARAHGYVEQVCIWEPALAEHGGMVTAIRHLFVSGHAERFAQLSAAIGERLPVSMRYSVSSVGASVSGDEPTDDRSLASLAATYRELFARALAHQRPQELRRGMTLVGPHRDELLLLLGGRELRTFGSAGQQRSAAIALRLLELATLRDAIGGVPLLLLDDPFAELDLGRAGRVLALLEDTGVDQVLLAVPRVEDIPAAFTRLERRTMRDGNLT